MAPANLALESPPSPPSSIHEMETAISETMLKEEQALLEAREKLNTLHEQELVRKRQEDIDAGTPAIDKKFKALDYLLNQSQLYANIMLKQMEREEAAEAAKTERREKKKEHDSEKPDPGLQKRETRSNGPSNISDTGKGRRRKQTAPQPKISSFFSKREVAARGATKESMQEAAEDDVKVGDIGMQNLKSGRQPEEVSGGIMRKYQLEGLEWMKSLYENGLNGILADEMGLGKTIQTISLLAFLRSMETYGPFLIIAPLSTTTNWIDEFHKWTPTIPVCLYHGSKDERAELRRIYFKKPDSDTFPVIVTSYEICMNDRKHLSGFEWQFIIIDEGHRIKNLNCRLMREVQTLRSANRLLITGTPLQNNLSELWSLLHFLMPDVFDKLEAFESWFDFSEVTSKQSYDQIFTEERKKSLVGKLHAILKPFLLRRVKSDVEKMLPKKREYVLYAPMTQMQRELYQAVLDGTSRSYLEDKLFDQLTDSGTSTPVHGISKTGLKRLRASPTGGSTPSKSARTSRNASPASSVRSARRTKRKSYAEVNDAKFFASLQSPDPMDDSAPSDDEAGRAIATTLALAKKQIATKKLQNPIMQLRLCCDSPHNFFNPFLRADLTESEPDETIVNCSGKMLLLDALLPVLFRDGHKVLIFSQFKTQLDILQMYAGMRGWPCCRIDGGVPQVERARQIKDFNGAAGTSSSRRSTDLFLLSTRAGGQGINLAAADTVVLYDSDWNPQQDLQAQDRAHRIGQTRNVIVYRLATRATVEQTLLDKAQGKRRLEKLVIRKGGLQGKEGELDELRGLLDRADGETFHVDDDDAVLSARDLAILTDRSDEAYERAQKGLDAGDAFLAVESRVDSSLLERLKV